MKKTLVIPTNLTNPESASGRGRANMVRYGIIHDHASKKRKIESTSLYSTFKVKYRKNVNNLFNGNEREGSKKTNC